MADVFEQRSKQKYSENPESVPKNPYKDPFEERVNSPQYKEKNDEGFWKSAARTALQIPQGVAEATPYGIGAGLFQLLGQGEALDPEEIDRIREISEREGIPFDEEAYRESAQQALDIVPTVGNVAKGIESKTGAPLEAKTKLQKGLRLGSTAGKFQPGTVVQKATAAVAAPVVSETAQELGVPEPLSEILGLGVGAVAGAKAPKIDIGKAKKPSGLPERQFENLRESREVPASKLEKINENIQSDFKSISDKIIKESPVGETFENLKNDPTYKQQSRELLNQAQVIADSMPEPLSTSAIKKEMADISKKNVKGISQNEYDKSYSKFMKESIKDIKAENTTYGELVEQYRKNNASLAEYFEPGASKALNRAKKDAILDQNRAIAKVFENSNPELSTVFKEGNSRWSKIMDAEAVDDFITEMFTGKVNYKKMHDFFDKSGYDRIFKRALGEDGYKGFEQLMKDMITSESPYKMLKVAREKGYGDMVKTLMAYHVNPELGYAKAALDATKYAYKSLMNSILDKPKLAITWKRTIDEVKKGDFAKAEKSLQAVTDEIKKSEATEASRIEALGKFNEKIKAKSD